MEIVLIWNRHVISQSFLFGQKDAISRSLLFGQKGIERIRCMCVMDVWNLIYSSISVLLSFRMKGVVQF
jgi:hypothetical protein